MDSNNWGPTPPGGEPSMDTGDWRTHLQPESRQRIVNKIMDTLMGHLPFTGPEGLNELKKIAGRFEEKIYIAATSQLDYLGKISLKILSMESKSQNVILPNSAGSSSKPPDPGSGMQNQVHNQGQLPIPLPASQSQPGQQILSQNIQNNMASTGVQDSSGLPSTFPTISGLSQTPVSGVVGQNSNIQNISTISHNLVGNSMGQGVPSNLFTNSQRQISGRPQFLTQQPQQQSQNPQQYICHQPFQSQLLKHKLRHGNLTHSLMQHQIPQQQQNILEPNQLQSSQQPVVQTSSVMQPSVMQSPPLSTLQPNQQSSVQQLMQSMIPQHPQILRAQQQQQQTAGSHQQQAPMSQQSIMPPQQQQQPQQLMRQPSIATTMQQSQSIGQQNCLGDMQQQQQQQRLHGQQINIPNILQQQQQQQQQQQLMAQLNLSSMHHQQLGLQSNIAGLQQQFLGTQSGISGMQTNQDSVHMLKQPKIPLQQQTQQSAPHVLPNQGQQSQAQPPQQQNLPQIQQPAQLQQQLGLQQQPNPLQRDMQQRLQASSQASGSLLQQQNVMDQQKQLYQSQRPLPETASTLTGQANGGDWQEEVYQRIKAMKEMYLPQLNEMYQKITAKLQQHDSLPQPPKSDQLDKLKIFKTILEQIISFLQVSKNNISIGFKENLGSYEKQIVNLLNTNRPRKPVSRMQQGQLPLPLMQHSMQEQQSQIPQVQSHDNQMNPQGSMAPMQPNNGTGMQQNSVSSVSGVSTAQQNMLNSLQPSSNMDSGQASSLSSLHQVNVGSLQQHNVSAPQQASINNLPSQSGVNMLQSNINPLQLNSNMLQHQHLKQEQQMLLMQELKQQYHQRRMLLMQQQQQQQQLQQPTKQQLPAHLQTHQMQQLHQMNDVNDMKMRQGMGVKPGVFQQHLLLSQRSAYSQQPMKPVAPFPSSSPQLLQAASPQMPQHSSPQFDQQNLLSSLTKTGTPLQSVNSPFVVPSPLTPLAPSPMPGDSEKPMSVISSLSNAGNIGHQKTTNAQAAAPSLAIGTPGISASPLLAEFSTPNGTHVNAFMTVSSKATDTEQPLDRLIKAVKSMSPKALSASVSDIGSVVSMVDRIAGSAPGNGSRAAVGEDLVAVTKCRLQPRYFITQDGLTGSRKTRRYTSAMPLSVVSSAGSMNDSFKRLNGSETSDLESTATSSIKRPRTEANHVLLEEIREINQRLIDTVVDISDEDVDPTAARSTTEGGEGTIVKCSFSAVALGPNLKSQYALAQMSPIQPLRLLVPTNYPNCSPVLLDKFPVEVSNEYEDLSVKAKSKFSISLRSLSQPMSLWEIARTWDVCARAVVSEYAQQNGGGSFSSKYGAWENCLSAS